MLKQTIQYVNFNDETVTEDFYFNFTMLEMIEQVEIHQVNKKIETLTATEDGAGAYLLFKGIVLDAYGVKSEDGKNFDKTPEIRHSFETSAAISELIISFLTDADKGIAFIRGVLPQDMLDSAVSAVEAKRAAEAAAAPQQPGLQQIAPLAQAPVAPPTPVSPIRPVETPVFDDSDTAANREGQRDPAVPVDMGVTMTTSEKRMYSQEELDAIQGVPGTVPPTPTTDDGPTGQSEYSDDEVLAMSTDELVAKNLLQRAYVLKTSGH